MSNVTNYINKLFNPELDGDDSVDKQGELARPTVQRRTDYIVAAGVDRGIDYRCRGKKPERKNGRNLQSLIFMTELTRIKSCFSLSVND